MDFTGKSFAGGDALEIMTKSCSAMTKGFQQIAQETTDYSKKSFEQNVAHLQTLSGARSLEAAMELQTSFLKAAYEGYVAQATRIGGLVTEIARDGYKPYEAPMAQAARSMQAVSSAAATTAAKSAAA